jgi:hypothetical protein
VKPHAFLVTALTVAALAGSASPAAADRSCPPGTDDPDYCESPPDRGCDHESKKGDGGEKRTPSSNCSEGRAKSRRHQSRTR